MGNDETAPTYRTGTASVPANDATASPQERAAALSFLQILATEVSEGRVDLPCFPGVVVRISSALADPRTTSDKVVTMVGAEPRLAARLLQTANSAAFNPGGRPLSDLRTAITRLGQQMVQSTAMSYAMQQVRNDRSLESVVEPLKELWNRSIAVASLCQLLAQRTKVPPDEAFLTGLLHGIGSLYIMVHVAGRAGAAREGDAMGLIAGWQAAIGKAVLESWRITEPICEAVGAQGDLDRRWKHEATLADILIGGLVLADALNTPEPRTIGTQGINAFLSIGVTPSDCVALLAKAEERIRLVHEALGPGG
jgi:HD-like signal output (HDOD) protein